MSGPEEAQALVRRIRAVAEALGRPVRIMEVCGTHTVSLRRAGIHSLLPGSIGLVSGPGCPVCVTPTGYVDNALRLVEEHGAVVATFGDMLRVPGADGRSLARYLGGGSVRIVYSPAELPAMAEAAQGRAVVFLGVGFETTSPAVAAVFSRVAQSGPRNLYLYSAFKAIPPALRALTDDVSLGIDAFLLPGHVSAIIGVRAYDFLSAQPHAVPGVIAGFEAEDMLLGILGILELVRDGRAVVQNAYRRAVRDEGNPTAREVVARLFEPRTEPWRGMGMLAGGALGIRPEYEQIDAARLFALPALVESDPPGCRCAQVVRGAALPSECPLFGRACTPDRPIGPCMVSAEGSCAAYYLYGGPDAG